MKVIKKQDLIRSTIAANVMNSEVIVLQSGYNFTDENDCFRAACSVTLVRNTLPQPFREGWSCIIVDTGGAWEKDAILMKLADSKISLNDIDILVGTHVRSDHVGNLNLSQSQANRRF